MKIKTRYIPRTLCGLFLAACAAEVTMDTGPVICAIDPTCRKITAGEIELVRPIFGDAVRYNEIRIFNRPSLFHFFHTNKIAQALRNNIYLRPEMGPGRYDFGFANTPSPKGIPVDDDHAGDFVHEVTHIWQYQNFGIYRSKEAMPYNYRLTDHQNFLAFNPEQQAEIVKYYFSMSAE